MSMKRLMTLACAIMMGGLFAGVFADEYFTDDNDIRYRILSESEKTCEVANGNTAIGGEVVLPKKATKTYGYWYTVKGIGKEAFRGNTALTRIYIPEDCEYVDEGAFLNCTALTDVYFEGTAVKRLGIHAFSGCTALAHIGSGSDNMLPTGLNIIEDYCFYHCSALTVIGIPKTCYRISKEGVFAFCTAMKNFVVEEGSTSFMTDKGVLYTTSNKLLSFPASTTNATTGSTYKVLDGTVEIYPYAFANAFEDYTLQTACYLTIPESVETIGEYAFYNYYNITRIQVEWEGESLQRLKMGGQLFAGQDYTKPHKLYIPQGTTEQYRALWQWNVFPMEEYDVEIRDFKINGEKLTRSTLNKYVTAGSLKYDAVRKELTMNNCVLSKVLEFRNTIPLQVYLYGENTIHKGGYEGYENCALMIHEEAEVTFDGYDDGNAKLNLEGAVYLFDKSYLNFDYLDLYVAGGTSWAIYGWISSKLGFRACNALVKGNNSKKTIDCHVWLSDCAIVKPAGAYVDEDGTLHPDIYSDIEIEKGDMTTYDCSVNGIHITDKYFPCLESGEAWVDGSGDVHLKNATIRSNGKGFSSPNSIYIYLEGNNYIISNGVAMYLTDDTSIYNEPGSTGQNSLTVMSTNDFGISTDGMIEPDDDVILQVMGKKGAIKGRSFKSSAGETLYAASLSPYEAYVILGNLDSDDANPVLVDINSIWTEYVDFVYSNYHFNEGLRTVITGYYEREDWADYEIVTKAIVLVPKSQIKKYDVQLAGSYINNFNADNFDPQNLKSGSVRFEKLGAHANLYLDNAVFDDKYSWEPFRSDEEYIDVYVKGKCSMTNDEGNGLSFVGYQTPSGGCQAMLRGDNSDGQAELNITGGIYLNGFSEASNLTIKDLTLNSLDRTWIWSEDECTLDIENSTLDLYNNYDPDQNIIEDIAVNLYNCAYEEAGVRWDPESWTVVYRDGNPVRGHLKIVAGKEASPTAITVPVCQAVSLPESPAYNLQGQRVGEGYRGIIITNGKKSLIQK